MPDFEGLERLANRLVEEWMVKKLGDGSLDPLRRFLEERGEDVLLDFYIAVNGGLRCKPYYDAMKGGTDAKIKDRD